jgi:lysophospholipase L1-like esterase
LALVVLEAVLQASAAYVRLTGRRPSLTGVTTRRRILSLGDSNTFGLFLKDRSQAYPVVAGRLWNEHHPDDPVEVLNMGYPGNSSSQILRHLPEMLAAAQPDLVTVMIGVNDFWTVPVPIDDRPPSISNLLWRFSRVYRLLYMLARAGGGSDVEVQAELPAPDGSARRTVRYQWMEVSETRVPARAGVSDWEESLASNLAAIAMLVREAHADLVFLTYPSCHAAYGSAANVIRRAAADTGTPLVDLASRFAPLCPRPDCPTLLYADQHPNAEGHALVAKMLADWLASRPR